MVRHLRHARVACGSGLTLLAMLVCLPVAAEFSIGKKVLVWAEKQYGPAARERVLGWEALVRSERAEPQAEDLPALTRANDYFNQVRWLADMAHWGQEDYWATPIETLASNGGDCEDFSIGKYFSLLESDFDPIKLRITYVKSLTYDQAHMVLAYYPRPDAEPLILDNIRGEVLPASQRPDLKPIYSFNGESIWLARDRGRKLKGNSQVSLPQWKALNERMRSDLP